MPKLSDTIRSIVKENTKVEELDNEEETLETNDEIVSEDETDIETLAEKETPVKQDVKKVAKKFLKHREATGGKVAAPKDKWGSKIKVKEETVAEDAEELTEAEAPKATPPVEGASRMAMINDLTKAFMASSDQVAFFNTMMATMHGDFGAKDNAASNKASIDTNGDAKSVRTQAMKEDVADLFAGEGELSEETKEKAAVLFEAAVTARALEIEVELEEAYDIALAEEVSTLTQSLTEQVENVLESALENWFEENRVAVESQIKTDLMSSFIESLKETFRDHYIEVPDDKVDVVDKLSAQVNKLEEKLNNVMNENIELKNLVLESDKESIFDEVAEGLTLTQVEKFRSLSEGVTFDGDSEAFKRKLSMVKENYFTKGSVKKQMTSFITEEVVPEAGEQSETVYVDPIMQRYIDVTSRVAAKK